MKRGEIVLAIFQPIMVGDLKPGAKALIGKTFQFSAGWEIEEGEKFAGDWAMSFATFEEQKRAIAICEEAGFEMDFAWMPSRDLKIIKVLEEGWNLGDQEET